ncbi:unnamed protein product, partial [Polarella glacialis]
QSFSGQLVAFCAAFATKVPMLPLAPTDRSKCFPMHDLGMQCIHSLFQAGTLSAAALNDFVTLGKDEAIGEDWATFIGTWGSIRITILSGLLEAASSSDEAGNSGNGQTLSMAEIGVFQANTSTSLLRRFPNLQMLLVDPYHLHTTRSETVFQMVEEFYTSPRSVFDSASESTQPFRSRATHVLQSSVEAAQWLGRNSLDMVFIDGDHRYESVLVDINAWWPKVKPGGILAGHDFAITFPGVVEAVTRFVLGEGLRLFIAPEACRC